MFVERFSEYVLHGWEKYSRNSFECKNIVKKIRKESNDTAMMLKEEPLNGELIENFARLNSVWFIHEQYLAWLH